MRRGYSLTEMMVVVLLIAIVSGYALPAIDSFMSSQKVEAEARYLVENVRLGRYKALQEQVLHRLAFEVDPIGDIIAYKVEAYTPYDAGDPDLEDGATVLIQPSIIYDSGTDWDSVIDRDEVIFDGSVEVTASNGLAGTGNIIYFYPTGHLVKGGGGGVAGPGKHSISDERVSYIDEIVFTFTYGNAQAKVYVNALGVLSTESYALGTDDE